jgi:iron-sulfur cluster insertion protein
MSLPNKMKRILRKHGFIKMIYLTEKAAKQIKIIADDEGIGHYIIRVGCKGGGCAGFSYDLNFDDKINELDEVFELDGVKIVCDPMSMQYLEGTVVDYGDSLIGGFSFKNPNAKGSCGCGHSFDA